MAFQDLLVLFQAARVLLTSSNTGCVFSMIALQKSGCSQGISLCPMRMFEEGLPSKLHGDLWLRLEFKFPTHRPDMPYTLDQLVSTLLYLAKTGIPLSRDGSSGGRKSETSVKAEASEEAKLFAEAVNGFTMAVERLGNSRLPKGGMAPYSGSLPPHRGPPPPPATGMQAYTCNFCGSPDHFIRACSVAEDYVCSRKCKRGEDGRLTLPNGMFLPRYITGQTMWEGFDKYAAEYARFVNGNWPADALMWSVAGMQYENIGEVDGFIGKKKKRREVMDTVEIPVKKMEAVRGGSKEGGSKGKVLAVQSGVRALDK